MLRNKSVLLGVTGGVAAYKSIDLARRLRDEGAAVTVILTEAARHFVTDLSFEVASQNRVYTDLFSNPLAHISVPANADIAVIAPATANIIGKFAHGIADDLLSTCLLSFQGTTLIAPAMNWRMYENPAVQENLQSLLSRGILQIGPEKGSLACGEEGIGRMAEVSDILEAIKSALAEKDFSGERILVTAGPTREYLDPVRFLSNRSSGKMGYALARAALKRGAEVTLISGPTALRTPAGLKFIRVETAEEMLKAVQEELSRTTVMIMAAAVSDYSPASRSAEKIPKAAEKAFTLKSTPDILAFAGSLDQKPFTVGFAAETGKNLEKAREKMRKKNADMIVFNDVSERGAGFDADDNRVIIIDRQIETEFPLMGKDEVADAILGRIREIRT